MVTIAPRPAHPMAHLPRPHPTVAEAREALRRAALRFGVALRHWRTTNGWAQDTAQRWGEAVNASHVYSSQWSQLETGKAQNPGPAVFWNLGEMNARIAAHDFGPVRDRALLDRLKAAMAVVHEDGTPWDAADFYACYVGELEWPEPTPAPAPDLTAAEAERWSEQYRQWFRSIAESSGRGLLAAAGGLLEMVDADEVARFEDVLLGGAAYSADELRALWRQGNGNGGRFLPAAWLDAWRADLGVAEPLRITIAGLPGEG